MPAAGAANHRPPAPPGPDGLVDDRLATFAAVMRAAESPRTAIAWLRSGRGRDLLVRDGLQSGARCLTRSWMSRPRSCGGGPTRSSTCVSSWSPPPRCPCETRAPLPATAHPGCAVGPRGPRRRQGTAQVRALPRPPGGPPPDLPLRGSGRRLPRSDQHPADHVALPDVAVHPSRQPAGHPAGDARPVVHRVRRQRRRRPRIP